MKKKKMQLDVGSEPYLSKAQALCLLISHIFYFKLLANCQRIVAMVKSVFVHSLTKFHDPRCNLWPNFMTLGAILFEIWIIVQWIII